MLGPKDKPTRKFCTRECYRVSMRKFDSVPYPMIYFRGKREYLHRAIYMQATGETLTPNDIIHHVDEDPFNRAIENLEKVNGRDEHLRRHNFHRQTVRPPNDRYDFDSEFGF